MKAGVWVRVLGAALVLAALAACKSGPVRRVSEPAARIQQLTVKADGSWSVDLRLENFSSIPMQFDRVDLQLKLGQDRHRRRAGRRPQRQLQPQGRPRRHPERGQAAHLPGRAQQRVEPGARIAGRDALTPQGNREQAAAVAPDFPSRPAPPAPIPPSLFHFRTSP